MTQISSATLPHVPIDRYGYRTGELVQVKYTKWHIAGFKQDIWVDGVVVGDKVCYYQEKDRGRYWQTDEDYWIKKRRIRKNPNP